MQNKSIELNAVTTSSSNSLVLPMLCLVLYQMAVALGQKHKQVDAFAE